MQSNAYTPLAPTGEKNSMAIANTAPTANTPFTKGLNRLVGILEKKIDGQIMAAQTRAYDASAHADSVAKTSHI